MDSDSDQQHSFVIIPDKIEGEYNLEEVGGEHNLDEVGDEHIPYEVGDEHIPYEVGDEHIPYEVGDEHIPYEVGDEHIPYEVGDEHIPYEAGDEHIPDEDGTENNLDELGGEHIHDKIDDEHKLEEVSGEHSTEKIVGEQNIDEIDGEHIPHEVRDEHIPYEAGDEHIPYEAGDKHIPDEDGTENNLDEVSGEHITEKVGGEQNIDEVGGENITHEVGGEHILYEADDEHISYEVGSEHILDEDGTEHNLDELGGEHIHDKIDGEHKLEEISGEHSIEKIVGEQNIDEVGGEHTPHEVGGEHNLNGLVREHIIYEVGGRKNLDEIGGEHISEERDGKHISDEVGGEHNLDKVGGERNLDEVGGEHIIYEVGVEHIPDEFGGEHNPREAGGEHKLEGVGREHIPPGVGGEHNFDEVGSKHITYEVGGEHNLEEISGEHIPDEVGGEHSLHDDFSQTTAQSTFITISSHNIHSQLEISLEQKGMSTDDETADGSFVMISSNASGQCHGSDNYNTENANLYISNKKISKEIDVEISDTKEKMDTGMFEATEATRDSIRHTDNESNTMFGEKKYSVESGGYVKGKRLHPQSTAFPSLDTSDHTHNARADSTFQNQASCGSLPDAPLPYKEPTKSTLTSQPSLTSYLSGHMHPMHVHTSRTEMKWDEHGASPVGFQPDMHPNQHPIWSNFQPPNKPQQTSAHHPGFTQSVSPQFPVQVHSPREPTQSHYQARGQASPLFQGHPQQWQYYCQPQPFSPGTPPSFASPTSYGGAPFSSTSGLSQSPSRLPTKPGSVIPISSPPGQSSRSDPPPYVLSDIKARTLRVDGVDEKTEIKLLKMYFQNQQKSGGGPVRNLDDHRSQGYVLLTFEDPAVADNVIKRPHTFAKKKLTVSIQVDKPLVTTIVSQTEQFNEESRTVEVRGSDIVTDKEMMEIYFEDEESGGRDIQKIEVDEVLQVTYITFADVNVAREVLKRKHTLDGATLKVTPCRAPTTIRVSGIKQNVTENQLKKYFESKTFGGAKVEAVLLTENKEEAFVTFTDSSAIAKIVRHQHHQLGGNTISITTVRIAPRSPAGQNVTSTPDNTKSRIVEVKGLHKDTSQKILKMYFENKGISGGGKVKDMKCDFDVGKALITFQDDDVVSHVLEKKHVLRGKAIQVGIFTPPAEPQQARGALQMNTVAVENLGPTATEETLMNYFENERRSGGGPVREMKIDTKKCKAYVTFENPADAKNVTSRDHVLDKHTFKVVLSKPPEVMKDHVVLRGLPDSASREQISDFVESLTDADVQTVLYGEEGVVVVVFKTEIDIPTVRTALTKRQLQDHTLSVEEVPASCTILVKFEKNTKLSKDALTLYFENVRRSGGGDVTEVVMGENGEYALVTFEDTNVAASVAKRKHNLEDQEMFVFLWMECLGINGGSEEPVMKPVDPVAISSSDQWKISLLKEGCQVMLEDLENELQKHHARLDWSDPERSVRLVCCLTPETPGARELAKTWADNVINVLQNHLSTVKMEEVKFTREEYIEMAPLLQEEAGEARVVMTFDEEKGRVIIVWDRDETVDIVRNLQSTISKVKEKFNRKKREKCVRKEINKWKMILLEKNKTDQKLKDKFPQLEVTYNFEECCMILKGVDEEIHEMELLAEKDLRKIISRSHKWTSTLAKKLLEKNETQRFLESTCTGQDSDYVLEFTSNGFVVHSFNEEKVNEVLMTGQRALEEHVIPVAKESEEARRLPLWEELKTSMQERNRGLILIQDNQSSLTVFGVNTSINREIQQLQEFLEENGSYQYSSQIDGVCSKMILTFMSENLDTRRKQKIFRIDDILFDDVTTSIVVKGNKAGIQAAQDEKKHFYRTLVCKKKTFTQPCMKEFLRCADWQSKRTEIEQKLKCRILEPAECPPKLASKAVVATTRRGELSQEVAAIVPAPEQETHTAEDHVDTAQKSKKEIQRKSEQVKLTPMKMRIFLHRISDITKEEHDALVNSSNTSLNLELGQVSKALVTAGGTKIQEDCKTNYPNGIKMGDIAVSSAGNLKLVKKLFHCCLPEEKDPEKIRNVVTEAVTKCLQKAEELELRSVGFPALGAGVLKYPPDLVAKAMYNATIMYSLAHPDSKVSDAIFILHKKDSAVTQAFDAEDKLFKELFGDSLHSADSALRQVNPNAQGIKTYSHFGKSQSKEILFFLANSSQVIEEAERELLECYHGKIKTLPYDVPHLDQWDDYHVTTVSNAGIAGNFDVTFNYVMGRLEFRGFEDIVRQVPVHLMIKNAEKHVQDKVQADLLAKQVQWSSVAVSETDEVLQPYSRINNYLIETAYRNGLASLVILCERVNQPVNINFSQMEESPENPEVAHDVVPMRIIRHDLLQGMALDAPLPDNWSNMNNEIDVVPLTTESRDYIRVAEVFRTSSNQPQQEIKRISRVQNKTLHKQYMAMKNQIVASLPPGKRCERDNMWHGTKEGSVDGIVRYGFNRSYSNCDENYYGQGVYFATEAEYSMRDVYATRNSNGERHIFMCKVLVGEYTVGKPEMRFPPEIPNSNGRRYNSVVDDKEKPSTFVIFSDVQAYPEYLIVFK